MNPLIATAIYVAAIAGLFYLAYDPKERTSKALWLPIAWLMINASRPVSNWLETAHAATDLNLEGSPFDRNIFLVILIAGVLVLLSRSASSVKILRASWPILLFISYCAMSVLWSDYPDVAFKRWIKLLGDLVMVLVILTDRGRLFAIKRLLTTVGFVLLPVSVLLIKYYPNLSRYYSTYEGFMFVSGVGLDKNMLGMSCMIFGLGAWWRLLTTWREDVGRVQTRRMIAYGSLLAIMLWLFWMANSATSESCFAIAAALMAMTMLFRVGRKPAVVHLVVGAALLACTSALFLNVGGGALHALGRNPTLTGRKDIWKGLLTFAGNPMFGTGFESFWVGERLRKIWASGSLFYGLNESHNGYLDVYLNEGWVGITLLALIIVFGYNKIVKAVRRDPQTYSLHLSFFVTALIYNFTEAAFKANHPLWILVMWSIMAAAAVGAAKKSPLSPLGPADKFVEPFAVQLTPAQMRG